MSGQHPTILSDAVIEMAFDYLKDSSEEIAMARGNRVRAEYKAKRVFASLFLKADGNIEMRKAYATNHEQYAAAMEAVAVAEETWERASDQRNRAEVILEVWRTAEASQRAVRSFK